VLYHRARACRRAAVSPQNVGRKTAPLPVLSSVRQPRIGKDVWALGIITVRETGPTANLLAPLVINLRSLRAVQAVMRDSAYSHQHALPEPAETVCS
jgi:flagellar assembly factor FliW